MAPARRWSVESVPRSRAPMPRLFRTILLLLLAALAGARALAPTQAGAEEAYADYKPPTHPTDHALTRRSP